MFLLESCRCEPYLYPPEGVEYGAWMPFRDVRMTKMRSVSLQCCSYVVFGVFVRDAYSVETSSFGLLLADQNSFSVYLGIAQVALAVGLFVGLINLFSGDDELSPLGIAIPKQLVSQPIALGVIALFLVILSFTDLPTLPLLVFAALVGALGWTGYTYSKRELELTAAEINQLSLQKGNPNASILKIELGSSLLCLAAPDTQGNLVEKIPALRFAVKDELGLTIPSVSVKDNLKIPANAYRISIRGGVVAEGVVHKDRFMVVMDEAQDETLEGIQEREPVFGLSAIWITEELCHSVGDLFLHAMSPVTVVMTHLSYVVEKYASELLTREAVADMVDEIKSNSPRVVDSVINEKESLSRLHHILKSLLAEQVPVRDLPTIFETVSDCSDLPIEACIEKIRSTLRRQICANVSTTGPEGQQRIYCVELPAEVEVAVSNMRVSTDEFSDALNQAAIPLVQEGLPIVVVSSNASRSRVRAHVVSGTEDIIVLSKNEIVPEVELKIVGTVKPKIKKCTLPTHAKQIGDKQHIIEYAASILGETSHPSAIDRIESGIVEITNLVEEVLEHESTGGLSPVQASIHQVLVDQGFNPTLATGILDSIHLDASYHEDQLSKLVANEIIRRMPQVVQPPLRDSSRPSVIALVGPTGVGKTTTIAKLATRFGLQQGRRIVLVTADTYRVAAVDQLQQYANIFDAQLEIASSAVEMTSKMASLDKSGVVLIDTAGRSAADEERIEETAKILQAARPTETHLVLSAATSVTASKRAIEKFSPTGFNRVIVTKLDEAVTNGEILTTLCDLKVPISWFTDGQDVSSHLEIAKPSRIVDQMFMQCMAV